MGDDFMPVQLKKCSICGKNKVLSKFHKDKRGRYGVRADCKKCRSDKTSIPKELHKPNVTQLDKICKRCDNSYTPDSNRQLYCKECQRAIGNEECKKRHRLTYIKKGYAHLVLQNANRFSTGIGIYQKLKKMSVNELKCERCGSIRYLLVHHRDRNRKNNKLKNLELLCKSCHQKEHLLRDSKGKFIGSK